MKDKSEKVLPVDSLEGSQVPVEKPFFEALWGSYKGIHRQMDGSTAPPPPREVDPAVAPKIEARKRAGFGSTPDSSDASQGVSDPRLTAYSASIERLRGIADRAYRAVPVHGTLGALEQQLHRVLQRLRKRRRFAPVRPRLRLWLSRLLETAAGEDLPDDPFVAVITPSGIATREVVEAEEPIRGNEPAYLRKALSKWREQYRRRPSRRTPLQNTPAVAVVFDGREQKESSASAHESASGSRKNVASSKMRSWFVRRAVLLAERARYVVPLDVWPDRELNAATSSSEAIEPPRRSAQVGPDDHRGRSDR